MKLKCMATLVALMLGIAAFPVSADHASCPGQESTVFFVNGMYAESLVEKHTENLRILLEGQGISTNCVHTKALVNHDEPFNLDLLEATIQKTHELGVEFLHGFGMLVRSVIPDDWFLDGVVDEVYSRRALGETSGADLDEHMLAYRAALQDGHRIVLACHSQGCLYTREAYFRMTPEERMEARWVTVVTPALDVPDGGPNTRLEEDAFAALFFAVAPLSNVGNEETCQGNTLDRWTCHGMDTAYLHGANSRLQIVNDIIELLPQDATLGTIAGFTLIDLTPCGGNRSVLPGGTVKVRRLNDGVLVAETVSDSSGFYRVSVPPGEYTIDSTEAETGAFWPVLAGQTIRGVNVTVAGCG